MDKRCKTTSSCDLIPLSATDSWAEDIAGFRPISLDEGICDVFGFLYFVYFTIDA